MNKLVKDLQNMRQRDIICKSDMLMVEKEIKNIEKGKYLTPLEVKNDYTQFIILRIPKK